MTERTELNRKRYQIYEFVFPLYLVFWYEILTLSNSISVGLDMECISRSPDEVFHDSCRQRRTCTVRAPVFDRHQFFGTSEHYGKAHGSLLSGWLNYNYTACCWFPTSSNILILPSQFWQIRFESCWLHCSKCRILVLLRYVNCGIEFLPPVSWVTLNIRNHTHTHTHTHARTRTRTHTHAHTHTHTHTHAITHTHTLLKLHPFYVLSPSSVWLTPIAKNETLIKKRNNVLFFHVLIFFPP